MNDQVLWSYINEVFRYYDRDMSGFLTVNELANFYNDLFARVNDPRRITQQQAYQAFQSIDSNMDGKVDMNELFIACKFMFQQQQYMGGYTAYQQPVNYQPQYMGTPQPQVIIINNSKGNTAKTAYNPYTQNPYKW